MVATRMMPSWRQTASKTRSSPTSDPVCASAARAAVLAGADLDGDDRLARRQRPPGRGGQQRGVVHRLQEQADHLGGRVVHQEIDHAGDVHVGLVAGGDLVGEPDPLALGEGGDKAGGRAALRDDADAAARITGMGGWVVQIGTRSA